MIDESFKRVFSIRCLIVGTRILGYNLTTDQLTPAPKVPIESVITGQSCNVKNLIWPKTGSGPFCIAGHIVKIFSGGVFRQNHHKLISLPLSESQSAESTLITEPSASSISPPKHSAIMTR